MTLTSNKPESLAETTGPANGEAIAEGTIWTDWLENPFKAIKAAADARGKPEDYARALDVLRESAEWPSVTSIHYMDDVLAEIAGKTNIVCQYDNERAPDASNLFRAAYDD